MSININGLQAFVRIVELGTFRQAAEALFITQSSLSRRISRLEDALGVRLIDRTTRRIRLTAIGKTFLPRAQKLIAEFEESVTGLKESVRRGTGQVIFACMPTIATHLMPKIISEYSARHPDNRVRILDVHASEALQAVLSGEVEFGISAWGAEDPEIECERLFDDPFVLVCHRTHPLARKKQVKWAELEGSRLITVGRLNGRGVQTDLVSRNIATPQHSLYEIQHSSITGVAMAAAGLGVVTVPRVAVPHDLPYSLVTRPLVVPSISRTVGIIRRRDTTLSPASRRFVELLKLRWHRPEKKG